MLKTIAVLDHPKVPATGEVAAQIEVALRDLGIEADLILFNPYGKWGFETLDAEGDGRYVRYVVAPNRAHQLFFRPVLDAFPGAAGCTASPDRDRRWASQWRTSSSYAGRPMSSTSSGSRWSSWASRSTTTWPPTSPTRGPN